MKYTPNPMQTNDITLSDDLVALTELIAANVHDVWAAGRIKEGWTYGEVKDSFFVILIKHKYLNIHFPGKNIIVLWLFANKWNCFLDLK